MNIGSSGRTPPVNPDNIYLSYVHNEHWATPDGLETWHVSADVRPEGGEVSPR